MNSGPDSFDPYETADAPLREKEDRLVKELEGVRAARAAIATAREMTGWLGNKPAAPFKIAQQGGAHTAGDTAASAFKDSPYFGMGLADAAVKYLKGRQAKHTQTTKEIWTALFEAGLRVQSDKPDGALNWVLRKREAKHLDILLVERGQWGLPEWYATEDVERIRASRTNAAWRDHGEHVERTKNGMRMAKEQRGVKFGRKNSMTEEMKVRAFKLLDEGMSKSAIARELGVSPTTINNYGITRAVIKGPKKEAGKNAPSLEKNKGVLQ